MTTKISEIPTTEQLRGELFDLRIREALICRFMAKLIINESDGEAATIQDFYHTLFGTHGGEPDHYRMFEKLGDKVEGKSADGRLILVDDGRDNAWNMGIIRLNMMADVNKAYRFHIKADPTLSNQTDRPPAEYTGKIEIPFQRIVAPANPNSRTSREPLLANGAEWLTLARVSARAHRVMSTQTWDFIGAENVHFGFEDVAQAAASIGEVAIEKLIAFHQYSLETAKSGKA